MEVSDAIRSRRSVRKHKPDPVPPELIREVLDDARWAPSWRNTQAWDVWVLTGAALDKYKRSFTEKLLTKTDAQPDISMPGRDWPARCTERTRRLMDERAACELAAGTDCSEEATFRRMGEIFGAPCLLVFGIEDCLTEAYACFDTGLLVQSVCLAAEARGLGTCIMATAVRHSEILHELLPGARDRRLVTAVVLGYPDGDAAINSFARERAELDEFVTWVD